jgi:Putative DNA-binding domain
MKDVRDWDEVDLNQVVKAGQKENTGIDYKVSAALDFKDSTPLRNRKGTFGDKYRRDLIRDVAAMANSEGGMIIYGIAERKGGYPDQVDGGIDPNIADADTIEHVIMSNIRPRVEGYFIKPIELKSKGNGGFAYVISIPKAGKNGPHQSDNKLYYKRHDATKLPMDDGEIRDMFVRSLDFDKKFGIARDLMVEIRRVVAAATERIKIPRGDYVPRTTLSIVLPNSLRSSGTAIMSLPQPLRARIARLISATDEYNSIVETVDTGQREDLRLSEPLRVLLREVIENGGAICGGLLDVLKDEP